MKKLMLVVAAALVSLSACSKSADEPVAQKTQSPQGDAANVISLTIEGEREDIKIVDEDEQAARAVPIRGKVTGSKITGTVLQNSKTVDGLICVYPKTPGRGDRASGLVRKVTFTVEGKRLRFKGEVNLAAYPANRIKDLLMDVYVGGVIEKQESGWPFQAGGGNKAYGAVEFGWTPKVIRTEDGMDLSQLNPLFYSYAVPISVDKDGTYVSTGHRFRLFGEFLSFRFRNDMNPEPGGRTSVRFNALEVRGFGIGGLKLTAPEGGNGPQLALRKETWNAKSPGQILSFPGNKTYYLNKASKFPLNKYYANGDEAKYRPEDVEDVAYTIYLYPWLERFGGVRMWYTNYLTPNPKDPSLEIFYNWENGATNYRANEPNYWVTYTTTSRGSSVGATPHYRKHGGDLGGTFNNLILRMPRYNANTRKYPAPTN
jgi:lipoprotein